MVSVCIWSIFWHIVLLVAAVQDGRWDVLLEAELPEIIFLKDYHIWGLHIPRTHINNSGFSYQDSVIHRSGLGPLGHPFHRRILSLVEAKDVHP